MPKLTRKSPNSSATLDNIGTTQKGEDGNIWIITANKNGVHKWSLYEKILTDIKTTHKIRFCEPLTTDFGDDDDAHIFTCDFEVDDELFELLKKKPEYIFTKDESEKYNVGNAYIFGPKYSLDEYELIGEHSNDAAQTGLVDITNAKELSEICLSDDVWEKCYNNFKINWDDRTALTLVQQNISDKILFVGETVGGDVGASLYGHFNEDKLDAIIIDNCCLFADAQTIIS